MEDKHGRGLGTRLHTYHTWQHKHITHTPSLTSHKHNPHIGEGCGCRSIARLCQNSLLWWWHSGEGAGYEACYQGAGGGSRVSTGVWNTQYHCMHRPLQAQAYLGIAFVILNHAYSYHDSWGPDTKTHGHQHIAYASTDVRIAYSDKIHFPQLRIKCGIAKTCPGTHTALQAPMIAWLHDGSTYSHMHTHTHVVLSICRSVSQEITQTGCLIPWRLASQVNRATTVISHTRKYHSCYLNEVITFLLKVHPPIYAPHAVMCSKKNWGSSTVQE